MNYEIGEVIAIRTLRLIEDGGIERTLVVKLGKPVHFPESSDCYVPFQITGIGSENILCASGIDGFQALQEVMPIIAARLLAINEARGGRLTWEGNENGELGFPIAQP